MPLGARKAKGPKFYSRYDEEMLPKAKSDEAARKWRTTQTPSVVRVSRLACGRVTSTRGRPTMPPIFSGVAKRRIRSMPMHEPPKSKEVAPRLKQRPSYYAGIARDLWKHASKVSEPQRKQRLLDLAKDFRNLARLASHYGPKS
jgi:hypothetical protein